MDRITVRFRWQPAEVKRLMRFRLRWVYRLRWLAAVVVLIVAGAMILVLGWPAAEPVVPLLALTALYVAVLIPVLNRAAAPARRLVLERLLGDDTVVSVDDAGVRIEQGHTTVFHHWPAVTRLVETREFVILEQGRRPLVSLPRRAFADDAEADAFVQAVRARLVATMHV